LITIIRSPIVVCDENEAFRGSMSITTPDAASKIPKTLSIVSRSKPAMEPTVSANTGIMTANNDVFDAFCQRQAEMKNNWFRTTPNRLKPAKRQ